ncbi:hypothetical protein LAC81_10525 [Ensifer adhaerens]|nr:hypothetical protein [Ensifer adhaerens]MBZ7922220.1 hypothetical protein [Ensifer adhaerens]UAY05876.1 hypothetical protein LAC81_10525 [Ensifer adhaerens]
MDRFREGLDSAARELLETHLALPREVHYVADLRRWMLSQMTMAMHFEHSQDRTCLPISPGNLARTMSAIASRNTAHAFLFEMRRYGFVEPLESEDGRQRAVRATEMSEQLIRRYFDIHLRALDIIDGGGRFALSRQQPDLLHRAQPRFARLLLERRDWHKPPPSIAKFVRSDSGSSVLHDLIKKVPSLPADSTASVWIGKVSPNALSSRYRISRTHTARLFGLAREAGLIGWAKKSNRGACWISTALVHDYRYWQAIKLSAVSTAFAEACLASGVLKAA